MKLQYPLISHLPQFFRKGTPIQIQIIGELLSVEWNLEGGTSGFEGNHRQVGEQAVANRFC